MRTVLCVCAVLSAIAAPAWAQVGAQADSESHIRNIENAIAGPVRVTGVNYRPPTLAERMQALHVPGVSVAFFRNGKIEWARGFGVTAKGGAPVTPETLFQAGSISKPVTAVAALRLVEQGRIDLDANVNSYLKGWKVPDNEFTQTKKVTLRELLTHTAGLTVHGFPGYARGEAVPTLTQILDSARPSNTSPIRVDTVPGSKWRYSGGGYVVMQKMLEDVTGKSFEALAGETVLRPMNMTHSTYQQPLPAAWRARAATPYDGDGVAVAGGAHTYPEMTAAGLWTTASDLALYAIEVQASLAGKSDKVLSAAMTRAMLRRGGLNNWGLGPELEGSEKHPYFGHGGVDEGFVANLTAYNEGDGVAIMINGMGGMRLAFDIKASIAREYGWPDFQPKARAAVAVAPDVARRLAGAYRLEPYSTMRIVDEGPRLFAQDGSGARFELFAVDDTHWFRADAQMDYRFEADRLVVISDGEEEVRAHVTEAQAGRIAQQLAQRLKDQRPQPGAEGALRKVLTGIAAGTPDYGLLNDRLAGLMRRRASELKNLIAGLGALKSVAFLRVQPDGQDVYKAKFTQGDTDWHIVLGEDGKIVRIGF